ncbi:AraC family transcriptional regulator [Rheinheimera sp. WS51]|uniref:AraC family transcriptional regulator n=1 Tax=Rheinheimera sp. WS51 TaxID=3425886 RepID=UPI003D89E2C2
MRFVVLSCLLWLSCPVLAQTEQPTAVTQLEQLKQQLIQLNRELFLLEEELLFPPETQVAVFVSIDTGQFFNLDSIQLLLNDKPVTAHLYTKQQLDALKRGAIQPLFKTNVKAGEHQLTAVFTGKGPDNTDYRRAVSYQFIKEDDAVLLELKIKDRSSDYQPEFIVQPWASN